LRFEEFEAFARSEWDRIPEAFREGVDGLVIERAVKATDSNPGIFTLGECLTETWPSDYDGPDSVRSEVILYWGSFHELAETDSDFDWEIEVWETLTHELRHHLESLARDDALGDVDSGMDQHFRRLDGGLFDPYYYRSGEARGPGWFALENAWFFEVIGRSPERIEFAWKDGHYSVPVPASNAQVLFLAVTAGVEQPPAELYIVVTRRQSLRARLRTVLAGRSPRTEEFEVEAGRP
jgi:Zincin-like metallopeptidase